MTILSARRPSQLAVRALTISRSGCTELVLFIQVEGISVLAQAFDICTGCAEFDLDLSAAAFIDLVGNLSVDRIHGVTWFFN